MPREAVDPVELQHRVTIKLHRAVDRASHRQQLATRHGCRRGIGDLVRQFAVHHGVKRQVIRRRGRTQRRGGGQPGFKGTVATGQRGLRGGGRGLQRGLAFLQFCFLRRLEQAHRRLGGGGGNRIGRQPALIDLAEHRAQAVVIALWQRIVFVVVAFAAFQGQAEKRRTHRVDPVGYVFLMKFLLDRTALLGLAVQPVEGGGQPLLLGRVRQQVAGNLPGEKLVVRQVPVEGIDHPVAPRPDKARLVRLIAVGVGKARQVQPVEGHALAEAR